ncbi:hypothetical protein K32_14990 [Kaistia sp. 32K]|uniref:hypothetical protein n=1 Tax=Kaistia sp. 32K TaxID=2795690 RepID=UPI001914DEF4|nr:hypothetical protein [Kaistia sp. 32K]BCP52882.1 hypothetical protein K32_14990 [Kaistia sp. 32K]
MTIYRLLRAIVDWAAEPIPVADNENEFPESTLWTRSLRELADLPIGPEPIEAQPDEEPERRSRCA